MTTCSKHLVLTRRTWAPRMALACPPPQLLACLQFAVFDRHEVTYCCEMTPSRWLMHVDWLYLWQPGTDDYFVSECEDAWREEPDEPGFYQWAWRVEEWPLCGALYLPDKVGRRDILGDYLQCCRDGELPEGELPRVRELGTPAARGLSTHFHLPRKRRGHDLACA